MPSPNDCNITAALGILQHQEGDHVQCFKVDVTFIRLCPAQQSTHARQFKLINVREVKNAVKYFEFVCPWQHDSCWVERNAALTIAKSGYGNVTEKWHFSWSRSFDCSSVSFLFFLRSGWQRHVIVPCVSTFLDMGVVWALTRSVVNCCNGDLLSVKCSLSAWNS